MKLVKKASLFFTTNKHESTNILNNRGSSTHAHIGRKILVGVEMK